MRDRGTRIAAAALLAWAVVGASTAHAQSGLASLEDATLAPRGMLRIRAGVTWTRADSRFSGFGVEPLGASLTSDSLGADQLVPLSSAEANTGILTGLPFRLSLGASRLDALSRREVVPLGIEYGISNRLSVGVTIPIVRARVSVQHRLDSAGANVGPNLHRTSASARLSNGAVQSQFAAAAAQLESRLDACLADGTSPGCPALLAREAEARALLASSAQFAGAAAALFGSDDSDGAAFVPLAQSLAQLNIAARVADFNAQYRDFLASGTDLLTAVPVGAAGPAGTADVQHFLTAELGRDSLIRQERVGFGDIEFGLKALVVDRPVTSSRPLGTMLAVAGGVTLPTGSRVSPSDLAPLSLGAGEPGYHGRAIADLQLARLGLLAVAGFQAGRGSTASARDARVVSVQASPRWHLSAPLAIHGAWTMRSGDVTGTTQLLGGGISFMNLTAVRANDRRLPIEMRFTHVEAVSGALGQPKYFQDLLEVRIYHRLLGR